MSEWRLAMVKTRVTRGIAGAAEEVIAWRPVESIRPPHIGGKPAIDLTGQRFGKLTVLCRDGIFRSGKGGGTAAAWVCECECGNLARTRSANLRRGDTRSCGCLKDTQGGYSAASVEYTLLRGMISRCHNPSAVHYRSYGGRGISVCDEWRGPNGLDAFLSEIGPRPEGGLSVDRIDNDGNYEPGNVRWATPAEQGRNKRNNRLITFAGTFVDTISGWSRVTGIPASTIRLRLRRGLAPEEFFLGKSERRDTVVGDG